MYRGQTSRGRHNGHSRSNGNLRAIALGRVRSRSKPKGGGAPIGRLSALFIMFGSIGLAIFLTIASVAAGFDFIDKMNSELPDVHAFENIDYAQPSTVYDRTGTIELAKFQVEQRRVVTFDQIPKIVLDATIAVEDRTFWENDGYDPNAIASAFLQNLAGQGDRGASTITQQLVRARLLPADVVDPNADQTIRKIKEILQARNLTDAFPGVDGKQRIITAYLNQIYYGHNAYGIAAAADVYFGIQDLNQLTPAQAAMLAGMPQAPDSYDLFKWAVRDPQGRLVVPTQSVNGQPLPAPVERRNFILRALWSGYGHFVRLDDTQLNAALNEPIVLTEHQPFVWQAPHFIWYMKNALDALLLSLSLPPVERGGYKIMTTLDMHAQSLAERYVSAGTILTNMTTNDMESTIDAQGLQKDRKWIEALHGLDIHNGALVAMDARSGDILAYVGSAGYYRDDLASPQFDPKFDVAGDAFRQPGSAWKPIVYSAGFDAGTITPGSLLLDVTTEFSRGWFPRDADNKERGPLLMRDALTYSLNDPTIRALNQVGVDTVNNLAQSMGIQFARGPNQLLQAGLAGAIGTAETNMVQLTSAYGALANNGVQVPPRTILSITDASGNPVPTSGQNAPKAVVSQPASWLITDVLKDSTDPTVNSIFGPRLQVVNGPPTPDLPNQPSRRPAAAKTGTTDNLADLSAYGYLAPPADPNAPELVASVWMGNSDHSPPNGGDVSIVAADGPGRVWQSFLRDYTKDWPVTDFPPPPAGIVSATIDRWSGGAPGPWTTETRTEYFMDGTQPGGPKQVDQPGRLYRQMCGGWYVNLTKVDEGQSARWLAADLDWMDRARRGPGRRGSHGTSTAYLFGNQWWGGLIAPIDCSSLPPPTAPPQTPTPQPSGPPPNPTPTPPPNQTPTPTPTEPPTPKPSHTPRPKPSPTPSASP